MTAALLSNLDAPMVAWLILSAFCIGALTGMVALTVGTYRCPRNPEEAHRLAHARLGLGPPTESKP